MEVRIRRLLPMALGGLVLVAAGGCSTGPHILHWSRSQECCNAPEPGSDEWWAREAAAPGGTRQFEHKGKLWPPYPRPMGHSQQFTHTFHAAHYWPYPYQCQDRQAVEMTTHQQVANGWVTATTLYDYHFDPTTHELNRAGELHLRWILENALGSERLAFVQAAENAADSQLRMNSVRAASVAMVGEANVPPIMIRVTSPQGRPAIEIVNIRRAELATQPTPHIMLDSSGGGGGAMGGAVSAGN
jgi:hypothetical protein